jgi:hypothetical protein
LVRNRVEDNARAQVHRTLDDDDAAVQRLARLDAANLVVGAEPSPADFKAAQIVADRLWLLSPRLTTGLRNEGRHAARALDDAMVELRVLDLVTGGYRNQSSGTAPTAALDAAQTTYETQVRPANERLPDWQTISTNTAMRRTARELERLEHRLRPT